MERRMRSKLITFLILLCVGCSTLSQADRDLLMQDAKNKRLELVYLDEIRMAEENMDWEAYEFFLREYIEVPRLDIPERLITHPDYFIGGMNLTY